MSYHGIRLPLLCSLFLHVVIDVTDGYVVSISVHLAFIHPCYASSGSLIHSSIPRGTMKVMGALRLAKECCCEAGHRALPLDRRVRGLEEFWGDSVGLNELSEEWRSRRDVAWIDGNDSNDSEGSLPPLLDGSDLDEQDLGDRQLGLDAAWMIHYLDDIVVYGGIPFGSVLSPLELLRR
jgi:hypothetical protein